MFNIRRFIKQHRSQEYDDLCLVSLPILVYNGERRALQRYKSPPDKAAFDVFSHSIAFRHIAQ